MDQDSQAQDSQAQDSPVQSRQLIAAIDEPEQPRINVGVALKKRLQGWRDVDIARYFSVTQSAVCQALKPFTDLVKQPNNIVAYRDNEAEILDSVALELSSNLLKKASDKKASVNNLAYASRQVFDMRRLLRGESTANVSQLTKIIQDSEGLHKKAAAEEIIQVKPVDNL